MTAVAGMPVVRRAEPGDAERVVRLFCEDGSNRYGWNADKWRHYYLDYPGGRAVALVAELAGELVGHYGMVPVAIGDRPARLGLHAFVSARYRGLTVVAALMAEVDRVCRDEGVALICGFANPRFSLVKKTLFKWQIPFWLGFKQGTTPADCQRGAASFYFRYPEAWYSWRFGAERPYYLSRFQDAEGAVRKQLLKSRRGGFRPGEISDSECWSSSMMYPEPQAGSFCQPFSLKLYDRSLVDLGILEPENWFLEMGDSDTFSYTPWSA